jgi:hypothetical protein
MTRSDSVRLIFRASFSALESRRHLVKERLSSLQHKGLLAKLAIISSELRISLSVVIELIEAYFRVVIGKQWIYANLLQLRHGRGFGLYLRRPCSSPSCVSLSFLVVVATLVLLHHWSTLQLGPS